MIGYEVWWDKFNNAEDVEGQLTLSQLNNLLSAKFLICFYFQSASMLLKVGKYVFIVSNSLDPGEKQNYSEYHLDPRCLHMGL